MAEDLFHLGVKAIIRNEEGKILLLKVNPKELRGNQFGVYWDIPGGRIHKGESPEETLKRELKEETGIDSITSFAPFLMVLSSMRVPVGDATVGLILAVYLCEIGKEIKVILSHEHTEANWFSTKEASEFLKVKYPKELTEKIRKL